MENIVRYWDHNIRSGRRPTPEVFVHLRKYVEAEEKYQSISTEEALTEYTTVLQQQATLYISNILTQAICQLIGLSGSDWITIKSNADGALHVSVQEGTITAPVDVEIADGKDVTLGAIADAVVSAGAAGTLSAKLRRISQDIDEFKDSLKAVINFNTADTHDIIAAVTGARHCITTIMFTVSGETNITFRDESGAFTGPMDFGGTNEPRGMVSNHGIRPLKCTISEKFQIVSTGAVQVSGYVIYYDQV